jgi:hypothetical protein
MFRRLIFTATIVFLGDYPFLQGLIIVFSSFLSLIYLTLYQPHDEPNAVYFEIYNEATILLVSYGLLSCCDSIKSDVARYNLGWALTGLILLNVVINFLNVLVKTGQKVWQVLKKLCLKLRKAKKGADVARALGEAA